MRRAAVALAALAFLGAGCGDDAGAGSRLVVAAAASLTEPLRACSADFDGADVALTFAGSDELAAQIRRGVRPDVFAAADAALAEQLAAEGLVGRPVAFATNELVIAVRGEDATVGAIEDLGASGVDLVVGAESVPAGAYARQVLGRLDPGLERAILANVRSEEPDVKGVVGKIAAGAADAGLVYATDVTAAGDDLEAIPLPEDLQPGVAYGAAVVQGGRHPDLARRYLDGLTSGACADALAGAGFGPPPG